MPAILFDFGGTLDTPGIHTRNIFYHSFSQNKQTFSSAFQISKTSFQDAYSFADQKILNEGLAVKMSLRDMNRLSFKLIGEYLHITSDVEDTKMMTAVADLVTEIQHKNLMKLPPLLSKLTPNYQLGIVSNFCGNLNVILNEYALDQYFSVVIDSFYLGKHKPDPTPFIAAIERLSIIPDKRSFFIGDNLERDILPAKKLGLSTVQIINIKTKSELDLNNNNPISTKADQIITDLFELTSL